MMLILAMLLLSGLLVVLVSVEESTELALMLLRLIGMLVMLVLLVVGILVVLAKQRERSTLMLLMLSSVGSLVTRGLLVMPLAQLVGPKSSTASGASTSDTLCEARARCSIVGVLLSVCLRVVGVGVGGGLVAVVSVEECAALESAGCSCWLGCARVHTLVTLGFVFGAAVADHGVVDACACACAAGDIAPVGVVLGGWCAGACGMLLRGRVGAL
jgi:hypothetical protein